jgi:hypothetical protein
MFGFQPNLISPCRARKIKCVYVFESLANVPIFCAGEIFLLAI